MNALGHMMPSMMLLHPLKLEFMWFMNNYTFFFFLCFRYFDKMWTSSILSKKGVQTFTNIAIVNPTYGNILI
jgi:hypothetical protein